MYERRQRRGGGNPLHTACVPWKKRAGLSRPPLHACCVSWRPSPGSCVLHKGPAARQHAHLLLRIRVLYMQLQLLYQRPQGDRAFVALQLGSAPAGGVQGGARLLAGQPGALGALAQQAVLVAQLQQLCQGQASAPGVRRGGAQGVCSSSGL
jgi:hypothetical protein